MQDDETRETDARDGQGDNDDNDGNDGAVVSRRSFVKAAGTAATVAAAGSGTAAASSFGHSTDALTPYVKQSQGWFSTTFDAAEVVEYENIGPEWYVSFENDAYNSWLGDWVTGSDNRVELKVNSDRSYVRLAAPTEHVVPAVLGPSDPLAGRADIVSVEPNRNLTNTEPLTDDELLTESGWKPPGNVLEQTIYGKIPASGSRFDSTGPYTLADATGRAGLDGVSQTGAGWTLAVIDTGLNYDSTLYGSRVTAGMNTLTGDVVDPSTDDYSAVADGNLHGSWVMTAAAGNGTTDTGTGAAPGADLIPIKSLDDDGSGTTAAIVDGIEYAANQGADVINMSLGSPVRSQPIADAVEWALLDKGVTAVVTAAGNARTRQHYMSSPAEVSDTIPVASIDSEPASESLSAYYSSVAPHPDSGETMSVAAGGHRVSAEIHDGSGLVDKRLSGTSMAAPVVAGLVACVLESDGTLAGKPVEMRDRLEAAAEPLPKCGVTEVGAGRIDAPRAVSGSSSDSDQSSARSSDATARDSMNRNIINTGWL